MRAVEELAPSWLLSESAIFSWRRVSAAPRLPRPEPRRLVLAHEPVVFCLVLRRKLGSSAGGDSLRFFVDFLKLASLACSPEGPGLELSALEDPGRESFGFGRLTLGLKRAGHSNLEELATLACSLSRPLRRGLGLEAERDRRALFWSLPCLTRAPGGAAAEDEEEDEVEAEEEVSVTVLHPALAEAADLEASLVGFADLPSARVSRDPAVALTLGDESVFLPFRGGEPPAPPLFLLCTRLLEAGCSGVSRLFLGLAGPLLGSGELCTGWGALGFLAGLGE